MAATVKAGISASLTGQFSTQGQQALAGLTAWVDYVNQQGGLAVGDAKLPVTLVSYDDGSTADNTRRATERLITDDNVDLLFGPYSAGLTTAAAEVAESHGRVIWNHGGAGDAHYARGFRKVISILTPADQYLVGAPELVRQANPEANRLVILRIDTGAFARLVARGAETAAHDLGFTTVLDLRYRPTQVSFTEIARHVAEQQPDLVVTVGRIRHDIGTARALARLPNRSNIGLAAVIATPIAGFEELLGEAADGFVGPSQWEPAFSIPTPDVGPGAADALRMLNDGASAADVPVDYAMAQAMAAGLVAERCVALAGDLDDDALLNVAVNADFTTFYGRFKIDEAGRQIGRSVALVQRQHGRKVVVWPQELAEGELQYPF
ncbi:MAG: amino acid ABC transporter substrate-binding protein [Chloroflexi bacterium]|nr:amino acid ABC transporter substrate-binding protein [Chloroflexota bacterium]